MLDEVLPGHGNSSLQFSSCQLYIKSIYFLNYGYMYLPRVICNHSEKLNS